MDSPLIAPGGEPSATMVGSLDMANERDRGMLRRTLVNRPARWRAIDDAFKMRAVEALKKSLDEAENIDDLVARVKARDSIVRTLAMLEGQNQRDEHHAADVERGAGVVQPAQIVMVVRDEATRKMIEEAI